jgi:hypothetical protein
MPEESFAPIITVHIVGLREAEARYEAAPEIIGAIMAERARTLDVSMQLAYRIHCPVGKGQLGQARTTGHLRDSIIAETTTTGATIEVAVGVPPEQANKVRWLREGTRPHTIVPLRARALHFWDRDGLEVFAKSVNHPGTRPNPWEEEARVACEALVEEAALTMGKAAADGLGTKV